MSILSETEYFKDRLDEQIHWYSNEASKNQKRYKTCRVIELSMAASIPVVLLFKLII